MNQREIKPRREEKLIKSVWRPNLIVLVIYTGLSLILTYPLIFHLTTTVPNDIGDPLLNAWILAWDSHAWLTDPLNLFEANIFHPLPNTLAYSEHLFSTALLILPLQLIFDEPILAYNLSLLLAFPLAGFGMYILTLRWTGHRGAAFIGGLIFAFTPYRFAAIAHLQLLTFHWLPFALFYLDRLLPYPGPKTSTLPAFQPPSLPTSLGFTLFFSLQILASWYLALYASFIIILYLGIKLIARQLKPSQFPPLILSFLIAALFILPLIWPYLSLLEALRQARPLSLALSLAATPLDFLAAAPFNWMFGLLTAPLRARPAFTEENILFVGIFGPLLACFSLTWLLKHRIPPAVKSRPAKTTVLGLIIILIISILLTFPIPYQTLAALFPPSTIVRVPARWIIPALFALASLAAFGYTWLSHRFPPLPLLLLTSAFLILETISTPIPLASVENKTTLNPVYHWLASQPDQAALIELPLHSAPAPEFPEVKRLYASTVGWWPLVNGYSGYTPPRQPELLWALAGFPNQTSITALQQLAAQTGPLRVLVHPDEAPFDRTRWETVDRWRAERNPALFPLGQFEGDYLFQIVPEQAFADPALAFFGPDKSIRLVDLRMTPAAQPLQDTRLLLYWQTSTPLAAEATVFIHFQAADGFVLAQADGPPVKNHYPTTQWQPGEIVQDIHDLPPIDNPQIKNLVLGLYDPETGTRYPAFGPAGEPLADDALHVPKGSVQNLR